MIERIKKGKLILGAFLLIVLAIIIPVTIGQIRKSQETRSRATGQAVSVILDPLTKSINVGDSLDVQVNINGADNNVSAVDISFTYDSNLLRFDSYHPSSLFTTIINDSGTLGAIRYVGVNPTSNPITGSSINIGMLKFKTKAFGAVTGTATVGFSNIHINASGVASALPVDTNNTKIGTYTIGDSGCLGGLAGCNPTPTVISCVDCAAPPQGCNYVGGSCSSCGTLVCTTPPQDATPTPTCIPRPACLDSEPRCLMPEPIGGWCFQLLTPSPTHGTSQTTLIISLQVTGVGTNSSQGLNNNPKQSERNVEVGFFNAQNQNVLSTNGTVSYNAASGLYKGSVIVNLPTGAYIVKVRLGNTLWRQVPGIQNIAAGTANQTPTAILVSGDLNRDNEINLIDYNLMIACFAHISVCNNQ